MRSVGVDPEGLDAILVTHDHRDHASGVGVASRRFRIPVYAAYETIRSSESRWGRIDEIREIEAGTLFSVRDLQFYPFPTPHDSTHSVGFIFRAGDSKGGIATDLGFVTRLVRESLKKCRILVVESNHEEEMLIEGPYPWRLKQRIRGRTGHLSNADCAALLDDVFHDDLKCVVLAHLSEVNNSPQVAFESVTGRMKKTLHPDIKISLARQDGAGEMLEV